MGDPKKSRKKYSKPVHPWQKERIDYEKKIIQEYGLKNKKEIWKTKANLGHYTKRVKSIISKTGDESNEETNVLLTKLQLLGLVKDNAKLDDVLSLSVKEFLERRLQTLVFRKGLVKSIKQARQVITHEHICINGKKISSPSYIVSSAEEQGVSFSASSGFASPDHPEMSTETVSEKSKKKDTKKEKEEKAKK